MGTVRMVVVLLRRVIVIVIGAAAGNCRITNNGDSFDHMSGVVWHSEGREHHMSGTMIMMGMFKVADMKGGKRYDTYKLTKH